MRADFKRTLPDCKDCEFWNLKEKDDYDFASCGKIEDSLCITIHTDSIVFTKVDMIETHKNFFCASFIEREEA